MRKSDFHTEFLPMTGFSCVIPHWVKLTTFYRSLKKITRSSKFQKDRYFNLPAFAN